MCRRTTRRVRFKPTVRASSDSATSCSTRPTPRRAVEFWRDVLNFRESDSVGEFITFMRCWPNPYHHGIGIAQVRAALPAPRQLHGDGDRRHRPRAESRLKAAGSDVVFGPGRHPASDSVFLYFLDPDGLTMEYSFGMEAFPESFPRAPRRIEPSPISLDYWGSTRDPRCFTGAGANVAPDFIKEKA